MEQNTTHGISLLKNWIDGKIQRVNPLNPKSNRGLVTLRSVPQFEEKTMDWMFRALQLMVSRFQSDTRETPKGHAKLTELSTAIGRNIIQTFTDEDVSTIKHLQVGDAVLGGFVTLGYIKIYRDEGYSTHDKRAPYIVEAEAKFDELRRIDDVLGKDILRATSFDAIPNVYKMIQGHGRSLIKDADERHEADLEYAIDEDLPWLQSVNSLQQQGWMINQEVYDVVEEQFDKLLVEVPPRPGIGTKKAVNDALKALKKNDTPANQSKFNHAVKLWNRELESLVASSKNVELSIIKEKAKVLNDEGIFYQFVELDYRGRVYYQEPMLNFQGPDMARGLLQFAEGKKLDNESGLKWLAIHTASSMNQKYLLDDIPSWATGDYSALKEEGLEDISVDKMTLRDREEWTWQNMDFILENTDKLLTKVEGRGKVEKPVAFLACCIEWKNYLRNPEDHVSYLPIPIDGSCNGYQHSAAIAKDEITGSLVSLVPQENQADLYVVAAKELLERMPDFFEARPDMKMADIRAGITKRAVMTRAYSAGKEKIADSMYRDCHSKGFTDSFDITMIDCMDLGSEVYDLIKDVCPGATKTMSFLQDLATYELGKFETFDSQGNKVGKTKKKRLNIKKQKLKKIKEPNANELKELNEVSELLASYETRCTHGNGSRLIDWYTPTGFHVYYEAYMTRNLEVTSSIPGFTGGWTSQPSRVKHVLVENTPYPNVQKFQAGISPNVIHSLDASHMAGVISRWNGSFGAVHDSFSAHASDIEELGKLTREVFVEMYDIDDTYAALAEMILSPCEYEDELPPMGSLDITEVNKAQYFFC